MVPRVLGRAGSGLLALVCACTSDLTLPDDVQVSCASGAVCPEGLKCEGGKCVPEVVEPECSDPDKPCPEGKKCVDGKCVDDVVQPPEEIDEAIVLQPHTASVFVGAPLPDLRARVTEAGVTVYRFAEFEAGGKRDLLEPGAGP